MNAQDIMTAPVIAVTPDTGLAEIVKLLLQHRISGMPVVDNEEVVGMVGDGDLLHRHEIGTDTSIDARPWWQRMMQPDLAPMEYARSHGRRASDVMSRHVVCVDADAPLAELATIFEDRRIRRIPVLREQRLAGLVTRADLVRALARQQLDADPVQAGTDDDEAIRLRLIDELSTQPWWSHSWSNIYVEHGIVRFMGVVRGEAERQAARIAAENVPGVRGVDDRRMLYGRWQPML